MDSQPATGGILRKGKYSKYNPEPEEGANQFNTGIDDHIDLETAPVKASGMISIADLLKGKSSSGATPHFEEPEAQEESHSKGITFDEQNIEEIN